MVADLLERRVVPSSPQLVADEVVGRRRDPHRPRARRRVVQIDEDLLPVRLVVVRAVERRAVVVHEVEVQVLEDDPAVRADDPPVVDVGADRPRAHARTSPALPRRSRPGPCRAAAARQRRPRRPAVRTARRGPGDRARGRPAGRVGCASARARAAPWDAGRAAGTGSRPDARWRSRAGPVVSSPAGTTTSRSRSDDPTSRSHSAQVAVDVRREEQLAVVVTDDRLVRAEELEVRGRDVFLDRDGHIAEPPASSARGRPRGPAAGSGRRPSGRRSPCAGSWGRRRSRRPGSRPVRCRRSTSSGPTPTGYAAAAHRRNDHRHPDEDQGRVAPGNALDADQAPGKEWRSDLERRHDEARPLRRRGARRPPTGPAVAGPLRARRSVVASLVRLRSRPSALASPCASFIGASSVAVEGGHPTVLGIRHLARVSSRRPAGRLTDPCET